MGGWTGVEADAAKLRASLELGKLYRLLTDARAEKVGLTRVIDESGEDYRGLADAPEDRASPAETVTSAAYTRLASSSAVKAWPRS